MIVVGVINLIFGLIECILGLFISGFEIKRIKKKRSHPHSSDVDFKEETFTKGNHQTVLPRSLITDRTPSLKLILSGIALVIVVLIFPKLLNRKITLVAQDGHTLPFAAVIIHQGDKKQHERTNNAGHIKIPRFTTTSITVNDPRYIEQTWNKSEIESELIVKRTTLGSSLDKIADQFLKPKKEK